ncbi:male accessory gland serine protease inhibitor-like [Drosophila subobscura]|uniref:male accessory gland serine protease inhibitor-like n=1 Tax=Drosophila subobscura TaxID=7241 RepID=UPI00155AADAC|nr:male accessory gland serine protease inhibitor-like [Drosophila subobscura]
MRPSTLIFVSLVLVLYFVVAPTAAERCKGKPSTPKCEGEMDLGRNNNRRKCRKHSNPSMWHYNPETKKCRPLNYYGCGGNMNRWCSKKACKKACRR